ncbi:response regulator transcription factor [Nocardioides faecalis]|uniref:response regulator transcription factor n=1 Tax=Nocardioides faecalis TaxID=2803858 RepID=UPI0020C0F009|nr:response regulator transcription factor [Nocardioides faecalis]
MPAHLLLVEDDDAIAAPLIRALEREGYDVTRAPDGAAAIAALTGGVPIDLLLLDLGLPDMDGLDVCRRFRADGYEAGIMILTARGGELDRVVGLDVGADDYLSKPFSLSELLARARALLRRTARVTVPATAETAAPVNTPSAAPDPTADAATSGSGLRVDRDARRAWLGATELALTAKEYDVLERLDVKRGAVVTRETLMAEIWDENWFGSTKTLDATIGRLRQKLVDADAPVVLATVRGVGFRLEDRPADA